MRHNGTKINQCATQINAQYFEMIMNSLITAAKEQIAVYKDEYMLSNAYNPPKLVGNAAAFYKVMMRLTTVDIKFTNKSLHDHLKDLPLVLVTTNGDIDAIHAYFKDTYSQLESRGEDVDDNEAILFAAYANVSNAKFQSYLEKKESDWYEDVSKMQGKDWKDIMKQTKAKYDLLKMDTNYKWGTPSHVEQKVIALQVKLADLKSENLQILPKLKSKLKDKKPIANQAHTSNKSGMQLFLLTGLTKTKSDG